MSSSGEKRYTAEDYWNLPSGKRAELIDGQLCAIAPPDRLHQGISMALRMAFYAYLRSHAGSGKVYAAPFAVDLFADGEVFVEPDISIIADPGKLCDWGCSGAPDLIVEIVSPGSRRMDYSIKEILYASAGVREYWVVDPARRCSTVYDDPGNAAPRTIPFDQPIRSGIYPDLTVTVEVIMETSGLTARIRQNSEEMKIGETAEGGQGETRGGCPEGIFEVHRVEVRREK